jgi:hypothetical protein
MAENPSMEVIKKNVAVVMGLATSILIAPPEIEQANLPVKWLVINSVLATVLAGLFATRLTRASFRRLRPRYILLAAGLLVLFSATYYGFYSSWTRTCSTGKHQYPIIVGSALTPDGQVLANTLRMMHKEPSTENILFLNECSSKNIYPSSELLVRYFSLIAIYISVTILLMALLTFVNYLIYYYVVDVPKF